MDLGKKVPDQRHIIKIAENLSGRRLVFFLKGDAVDAQDIIFKGRAGNGLLCVFQIRRNDDQISGFDRTDIPAEEEVSFAIEPESLFPPCSI